MTDLRPVWRPLTLDDAEAAAGLQAAAEAVDDMGESYSPQDFREELSSSGVDLERGTVAAFAEGRMVALGVLQARTAADPVHQMYLWGVVHPESRGRGLGSWLLEWAQQSAPEISRVRFPDAPLHLNAPAYDKMSDHGALLESFGYQADHYDFGMLRRITPDDARDEPALPEGFALVGFGPDVAEEFRAAHNAGFVPDHPGSTVATPDVFAQRTGSSSFRADLSFGLRDAVSDTLAGYVLCYYFEADTASTGLRDLYFNYIGTRREFRGRGVAGALIKTAVHAAAKQGFDTASLGVLAQHPTGALRLYRRLGFEVRRTFVTYTKRDL